MGYVKELTGPAAGGAREMALQSRRVASHQSKAPFQCIVAVCLLSVLCILPTALAATINLYWEIDLVNYTRNCVTKPIPVVNGLYPGPTVYVSEEDRVIITVVNKANTNVTIHWHGIRQWFSGWQDGVGYITQCSIQPGDFFTYDFVVFEQSGTAFWHAHVGWLRATVHGAFITKPSHPYPFPAPYKEFNVILGEWWNLPVDQVEATGLAVGGAFPNADALTINGYPGAYYNCSATEGLTTFQVQYGKTYFMRIINAALNTDLFFGIANHALTVVEADSNYVKPFVPSMGVLIGPGQTLGVLVTANQPPGSYYAAGKSYSTLLVTEQNVPVSVLGFITADVPPIPTTAIFQYKGVPVSANPIFPILPAMNDTTYQTTFDNSLKTLHPENVPSGDDVRHLFFSVGTSTQPCTPQNPCAPSQGAYRVSAAINNITLHLPTIAVLQAYFFNTPGVFSPTFPDFPLVPTNYTNPTGPTDGDQVSDIAVPMEVVAVEFGTTLELVLQDNNNFAFESHPFHLHGYFFHILAFGTGNYDPETSPNTFNNYDPPARFTVNVPRGGWVAIRWKANNPGVWFLHCHLDKHLTWGMATAFIVKNGPSPYQALPPPPKKLTAC